MFITIKAKHERGTNEIILTTFGVYQSFNDARKVIDGFVKEYREENYDARVVDDDTSVEMYDEFFNWVKLMVFDTDVTYESERARNFWQGERGLFAIHELEGGDDLYYEED